MAEFATIRRWTLNEGVDESTLLTLVSERLIPAYKKAPGCLRQHLFRGGGPRSYVALTFWESKAAADAWAGPGGQAWRDEHRDTLARWLELMSFREEFDAEVVVSS
jgi:heme-degrading monooxygenase HmoA